MEKAYTVLVILEAKPGKEAELKQALMEVISPSRSETTCIEYRLHQDLNNPAQLFLYENWASKEAHEDHFKEPYIEALAGRIDSLLNKPWQLIFSEELRKVK